MRKAADLYDAGKVREAAPVSARYRSTEAAVGSALASWPSGFDRLAALAARDRRSSLVQLHYGLGLYWRGDMPAAKAAWRLARRAQPDTPYALRAEDLLYPRFPRGLPTFVPSFLPPPALAKLSPPSSSTTSARTRRTPGATSCSASPTSGSAGSSRRSASSSAHRGPEAEVARAVGRFDKADPSRTFSRLGPLAKRYPAEPKRPLPPRPLPALARLAERGQEASSGSPATSARARRSAPRRADSSSGCREKLVLADTKIGRMAYGASSGASGTLPPSWIGGRLTGHQVTASLSA